MINPSIDELIADMNSILASDTHAVTVDALRVSVHVIRVGGNKLTKQMFNQIPRGNWHLATAKSIFGYVRETMGGSIYHTYLFSHGGQLYQQWFKASDDPCFGLHPQIYIGA